MVKVSVASFLRVSLICIRQLEAAWRRFVAAVGNYASCVIVCVETLEVLVHDIESSGTARLHDKLGQTIALTFRLVRGAGRNIWRSLQGTHVWRWLRTVWTASRLSIKRHGGKAWSSSKCVISQQDGKQIARLCDIIKR
jgi:hypothetical protein